MSPTSILHTLIKSTTHSFFLSFVCPRVLTDEKNENEKKKIRFAELAFLG